MQQINISALVVVIIIIYSLWSAGKWPYVSPFILFPFHQVSHQSLSYLLSPSVFLSIFDLRPSSDLLFFCECVCVGAMDLFSLHHLGWQEQLGLFCISMCVNKSRRRPDGCLLKSKSVSLASCYMYHIVQLSSSNSQREENDICVGRVKTGKKGLKKVKEE